SDAAGAPAPAPPSHAPEDRFPEPEPAPVWSAPAGTREVDVRPLKQPPAPGEFPTFEEMVGTPGADLPVPDPAWETTEMPSRLGGRRRAKKGAAREGGAKRSPVMLILLLLLLLAAGAYFVLTYRPDLLGLAAADGGGAPPPAAPPSRNPSAAPTERGVPLPYAVSTVAYDSPAGARNAVRDRSAKYPDVPFYVVPELNQDRLFYKVFAGMLADTAQAAAVRDRLVAAGDADTAGVTGPWQLIQPRPWAYDLGLFDTDSAATVHADSLAEQNVPTYVVPIPFSDGRDRFRVYGGAFADSLAARPMLRIIQFAHVSPPLVRRTGRAPAAVAPR
ncbi:MAG TPA: SPOR domain-containing protein, partial [Longimicrobiaceae bacterium]|nr:SPOR domain-containing protein [Longimicrobiaceae bacterium]